jgi:hypothetical protein
MTDDVQLGPAETEIMRSPANAPERDVRLKSSNTSLSFNKPDVGAAGVQPSAIQQSGRGIAG